MPTIDDAVSVLRGGGLIAFPTETVYGLGADATNAGAVRKIFEAKGRPATNPLICHVADKRVARRYAREWPLAASRLAERFWPGPLTLVLQKTNAIPPEVTAGLDSVGLRAPDHPLTLELLRKFDRPVAGPSANRSNHVSPTTAQHVRDDLGDAVDLILDGGPCAVGIESTVLDLTGDVPVIRRPGGVSREAIEKAIGPVELFAGTIAVGTAAVSPGQHEKHYAPRTPAYWYPSMEKRVADSSASIGIVKLGERAASVWRGTVVEMPGRPEEYAKDFYAVLRQLDAMNLRAIYIEMVPDEPAWLAVRDRIARAARPMPE